MKAREQKSQFSNFSVNWGNFRNIHSARLPFQNPNVESMGELGSLCPNLSFTVKN